MKLGGTSEYRLAALVLVMLAAVVAVETMKRLFG